MNWADFLGLDVPELWKINSSMGKAEVVFQKFISKIHFDSTTNFLKRRAVFSPSECGEILENGGGLCCQEQVLVLKELLLRVGVKSQIIHGDVYDLNLGIIKPLLTSGILVKEEDKVLFLNSTSEVSLGWTSGAGVVHGDLEVVDVGGDYFLLHKSRDGEIHTSEKYYKKDRERFRIERLERRFPASGPVPFGIINPYYWRSNPERKIFYNLLRNSVRIQSEQSSKEFNLLDWAGAPEAEWLNADQKARVKLCIGEVSRNLEEYMEVSNIKIQYLDEDFTPKDPSLFEKWDSYGSTVGGSQ